MSNKILAIGVSVVVFVVVFIGAWQVMKLNEQYPPRPDVPYAFEPVGADVVASDFGTKIVYRQDTGADIMMLQKDCARRGGTYNECGSVCAPDAEMCVLMCGWTCDNIVTSKPIACDATIPCPDGQSCYSLSGASTPQCVTGNVCEQACGTKDCVIAESYPPQVRCQK